MYHNEKKKHVIAHASSLKAEISFLEKLVDVIKEIGNGKSVHQEMLDEMQTGLTEKKAEYEVLSIGLYETVVPEEFIAYVKYDIQTLIGLLDAEGAESADVASNDWYVCFLATSDEGSEAGAYHGAVCNCG
ncbi:hypothetical protein A8L34_19440 [Bacillus sp. FJAT-27264]|uniref:hypothetical protein n=1 Tax=Paenibacillus sp. (strain DSM 101736 / FJAT-27264) TaxID=1850362 RepID=UPI00080812B8|nr:hypothetical protein [Bacillus sp. FJAT-27264]OBZ10744.1 hypothetical protein A8L34_19440 [Bacillus sp. FJAT-27264]